MASSCPSPRLRPGPPRSTCPPGISWASGSDSSSALCHGLGGPDLASPQHSDQHTRRLRFRRSDADAPQRLSQDGRGCPPPAGSRGPSCERAGRRGPEASPERCRGPRHGLTADQLETAITPSPRPRIPGPGHRGVPQATVPASWEAVEERLKQGLDYVETLRYLGATQYERGEYRDAADTFRKALAVGGGNTALLSWLVVSPMSWPTGLKPSR